MVTESENTGRVNTDTRIHSAVHVKEHSEDIR